MGSRPSAIARPAPAAPRWRRPAFLGGAAAVARGVRLPQSQQLCPRAETEQGLDTRRSSPLRSSPSSRPVPAGRAGTQPAPPSPAHSARPAARSSSAAPGRPASGPAALSGRGAAPDGQRRTPPRARASRGGRPATPTRCSPCPYPPGAPAQHSFSAAVQPPLHGRLFYLNHLPKSTYLILSAPSEGSEIRFFCKKETRLRKAGFPACAAPAFFCKNVTFMLYFYHKSLFLVKMICVVFFQINFTSPIFGNSGAVPCWPLTAGTVGGRLFSSAPLLAGDSPIYDM